MKKSLSICVAIVAGVVHAVTTGVVPADGASYQLYFNGKVDLDPAVSTKVVLTKVAALNVDAAVVPAGSAYLSVSTGTPQAGETVLTVFQSFASRAMVLS